MLLQEFKGDLSRKAKEDTGGGVRKALFPDEDQSEHRGSHAKVTIGLAGTSQGPGVNKFGPFAIETSQGPGVNKVGPCVKETPQGSGVNKFEPCSTETSQGPGANKFGPSSSADSNEHPLPKRPKLTSSETGNEMSKDSGARHAHVAQHNLHNLCEHYYIGDRGAKPAHFRVRTKSKSERLLGRTG